MDKKTVIFGHAGSTIYPERWVYPQNTRESVLYGLDVLDADGVEIDVRISLDSVAMIFHDASLEINTDGHGCLEDMPADQIANLHYFRQYRIMQLHDVVQICQQRGKKLFVDLKQSNECSGVVNDFDKVSFALNEAFRDASDEQKKHITVNCRNYDMLVAIEDSLVQKSFETEDLDLGVSKFELGKIDELTFRDDVIDHDKANYLRSKNIPFCLFGMKVQKLIRRDLDLDPDQMISDNVAYTKKEMN